MQILFNMILAEAGIEPRQVRLLRHQASANDGLSPYTLWRDDRLEFERYQSAQLAENRSSFARPYWAGFVVPPNGSTLFAGLYAIGNHGPASQDWIDPLLRSSVAEMEREIDIYEYSRLNEFENFVGRLKIEWGPGQRSWSQKADSPAGKKKYIIELSTAFREPDFPGYTRFLGSLAQLATLPTSWSVALRAARGVYLLTCPRTKEQYVGSASGLDGFWGRWQNYVASGHGGNVGLKIRDPSNYQVSILEVVGSAASVDDIIAIEQLWKSKLQSREMGLNKN